MHLKVLSSTATSTISEVALNSLYASAMDDSSGKAVEKLSVALLRKF
ncbi:hypothetical protein [Nostoc sp. 106C]|nr:hypothetical protein [Nostoc sp. 106C]